MIRKYYSNREEINNLRKENFKNSEVVIIKYESAYSKGTMILTLQQYEKKKRKIDKAFKDCIITFNQVKVFTDEDIRIWENIL